MTGAGAAFRRLQKRAGARTQGPVRARVVAQHREVERYTVDAEVLTAAGQADPNWPIIPDIEVARLISLGGDTGIYLEIAVDALIRVAFYDLDPNRPYLDAVLGGPEMADATGVSLWIKGLGASIKLTNGGVSISGGGVSVSGGMVTIGAGEDEYGNGGEVAVEADNGVTVKAGEGIDLDAAQDLTAKSVTKALIEAPEIVLGEAAAEFALLGNTAIDLITSLKVGGVPIDAAPALKTALMLTALSAKVKVQ